MKKKEFIIRDKLSARLDLLESGLILLKNEKYLPNPDGTRGFIDIFAQDKDGKYVLIELKRSAPASREALHEVLKYLEGIKQNISLRDDEIRVFIVSTDWSELLVPFSSFVERTLCSVSGYELIIDENNTPLSSKIVKPIALASDRLFAPWHELNLYVSEESLQKGLKSYQKSCKEKDIKDYVLVVLHAPAGFHKNAVASTYTAINELSQNFGSEAPEGFSLNSLLKKMPKYKFIIYFATIQLERQLCLDVIRQKASSDDYQEFMDYIEKMHEEEELLSLHVKMFEVKPRPSYDYYEIGYPAKFGSKLLDEEGWKIEKIYRYGKIAANKLLTDETIVSELRGNTGNTGQKYHRNFTLGDRTGIALMKKEIKGCLEDNPVWRNHIIRCIDEIGDDGLIGSGRINIFNPSNFCLTMYQALSNADGVIYMPSYYIILNENEDNAMMIFGDMETTGVKPSFKGIIEKYYNSDLFQFLLPLNWGGYESRDVQIMRDVGIKYVTYKCENIQGSKAFSILTDIGWEPCEAVKLFMGFQKYIFKNNDFVDDVCSFYASHWNGVISSYDRNEQFSFKT
jgi:hypothetical protein